MEKDFLRSKHFGSYRDTYLPEYDEYSDFNTNAKSYYDYLARYNKLLNLYGELINRLLRRDIETVDTNSIEFKKIGDWIDNGNCPPENFDDLIKLLANVKISLEKELADVKNLGSFNIKNGSKIKNDGIWSPDYKIVLDKIADEISRLDNLIKKLDVKIIDNSININTIRGINMDIMKKDVDYKIEFYNGFYSPKDDLIVAVGETTSTLDINISSHSTDGYVLKNDGDLKTNTELSLRPDKDYPEKCNVFSIELIGKYKKFANKEIVLDNTGNTLWHISPKTARATWDNLLTPHNIDGKLYFSWRQINDGYSNQLRVSYADTESLKLAWGNVNSKITLLNE